MNATTITSARDSGSTAVERGDVTPKARPAIRSVLGPLWTSYAVLVLVAAAAGYLVARLA